MEIALLAKTSVLPNRAAVAEMLTEQGVAYRPVRTL